MCRKKIIAIENKVIAARILVIKAVSYKFPKFRDSFFYYKKYFSQKQNLLNGIFNVFEVLKYLIFISHHLKKSFNTA